MKNDEYQAILNSLVAVIKYEWFIDYEKLLGFTFNQ